MKGTCPVEDLKQCLAQERGFATRRDGGGVGRRKGHGFAPELTKPSRQWANRLDTPSDRTFGRTAASTNSDQDSGARPNLRRQDEADELATRSVGQDSLNSAFPATGAGQGILDARNKCVVTVLSEGRHQPCAAPKVAEVLLILYLRGLSASDFRDARYAPAGAEVPRTFTPF